VDGGDSEEEGGAVASACVSGERDGDCGDEGWGV